MKAIVQEVYGSPDLLRIAEVPTPPVGDHDVLVRVRAASVHPDVWHMIRGEPRVLRLMGGGLRRPKAKVPGTDLAGVVEATGDLVTRFRSGDEVFGKTVGANAWRNGGAYAELASVHEDRLEAKLAALSFEQAAAAPDSGTIAIQGLRDEGRIESGQRVLINGAGGGVGSFAVQIAKAFGASEVTAVDLADKIELLPGLGADHVVDADREDFTRLGDPFDLILDIPANRPYADVRRVLADDGTYVLIGHDAYGREGRRWIGSLGRFLKLLVRSPFDRHLPGLRGANDPGDRLRVLRELLDAGSVTPAVDRTFPLEEVPAAIRMLEEGRVRGKLVITVP
jgi:NADPH:quinone reductase-like Zn-dependent oxidoreductase